MLDERYFAPAVELANGSYWVLGGSNAIYTSEIYSNGEFHWSVDIPRDNANTHLCAVRLNDEEIFYAATLSYIFNVATETFTETESPMLFYSFESMCGVATKSDGSRIIVVAGG